MSLTLRGPAGELVLDGSGRMLLIRHGRALLRSAQTPIAVTAYGLDMPALRLAHAEASEQRLQAQYVVEWGNIAITCEATPTAHGFRVRWVAPAGTPSLTAQWELEIGQPWYGYGERVIQTWPLDRTPIISDPFMPYDHSPDGTLNIVTPLWLNAAGAGLLLEETDGELATTMQRGNDGLLRITAHAAPTPFGAGIDGYIEKPFPAIELHLFLADDLPQAQRIATSLLGRPKTMPPAELFARPIWTTWAHYKMAISQAGVEEFANTIIERGYPYSVLEIDDRWQRGYGATTWDFAKFPDPRKMIDKLHDQGFKVTLWTPTFFDPRDPSFAEAAANGFLVKHPTEDAPYLVRWWQGYGGTLDMSNPAAREWWLGNLQHLQREYGVDGFKFDAGEGNFLPAECRTAHPLLRRHYADRYVEWVANNFTWTEVRTGWRSQAQGIFFREWDKWSRWGLDNGLHSVLTQALMMGLIGYPYVLPDMIGGNAYAGEEPDGELMVRWTQLTALLPAMQFGIPPWKYGDEVDEICRKYARLHEELTPTILQAAEQAQRDGSPLVRPIFWDAPHDAVALSVDDEFLLGDRFLVAPVVQAGQRARDIYLPAGEWRDYWSGTSYSGSQWLTQVDAPLEHLPLFERVKA